MEPCFAFCFESFERIYQMLCSKSRSCLLCFNGNFRLYLSLPVVPVKCLKSTGFTCSVGAGTVLGGFECAISSPSQVAIS